MKNFKVSTRINDREDEEEYFTKQQAEDAAKHLALSGFFSTLWVLQSGADGKYWMYLCEYAAADAGVQI
jgi:hypothetical protein